MSWILAIIAIILVVVFWRIFLPLALFVLVVGIALIVYLEIDKSQSLEKQKIENLARLKIEMEQKKKIEELLNTAPLANESEWQVYYERDPASSENVARTASVTDDSGLCSLRVEKRITGAQLTGIYCKELKIKPYESEIFVKFDSQQKAMPMRIRNFSDSGEYYIESEQSYRYLKYQEFLRLASTEKKVALRLNTTLGEYWIAFTLKNASDALNKINSGAKEKPLRFVPLEDVNPKDERAKKSVPNASNSGFDTAYLEAVQKLVAGNTSFYSSNITKTAVAHFLISLTTECNIESVRLTRTSGVTAWDNAAERGILRSNPFPRRPDGSCPAQIAIARSISK